MHYNFRVDKDIKKAETLPQSFIWISHFDLEEKFFKILALDWS